MIEAGMRVRVVAHDNWTADYKRLAASRREGVVDRLFTALGAGRATARVVFPKEGRRKERVEFFHPSDLEPAPDL